MNVFLVASEESGDQLGFKLMRALRARAPGVAFQGVGGKAMEAEGLRSLFPLSEVAVMGVLPVIRNLPHLLRRIRETADAVVAARPDVLVIIDSPDFTHRVAQRVRRRAPSIPIVDYVSPTVWAWRPGRARKMRAYVDRLLALLPFEPEAHLRLGGPPTTYVGHPLMERLDELRPGDAEARARADRRLLVLLPGSRRAEIARMLPVFGETLARVAARVPQVEAVLPAVDHLAAKIDAAVALWPVKPRILRGEAAKFEAFRQARAALAASGTVTLELALAGVPMAAGYRMNALEVAVARRLVKLPSFLLPNIILGGEIAVPQFLQNDCSADNLAPCVEELLIGGPARDAQIEAFARIDALMRVPNGETPSAKAAEIVLNTARR